MFKTVQGRWDKLGYMHDCPSRLFPRWRGGTHGQIVWLVGIHVTVMNYNKPLTYSCPIETPSPGDFFLTQFCSPYEIDQMECSRLHVPVEAPVTRDCPPGARPPGLQQSGANSLDLMFPRCTSLRFPTLKLICRFHPQPALSNLPAVYPSA